MQETQLSLSSSLWRRNTQCCNREREGGRGRRGKEKRGEGEMRREEKEKEGEKLLNLSI